MEFYCPACKKIVHRDGRTKLNKFFKRGNKYLSYCEKADKEVWLEVKGEKK